MIKKFKYSIAIFLTSLLIGFIAAPTIISTIDDSIDITAFFGVGEEEESENLEILIDYSSVTLSLALTTISNNNCIDYTCNNYPNPSLNLVSPPPEQLTI